jgi:acyl-coenzyme A thioesterase PaaI-like protein
MRDGAMTDVATPLMTPEELRGLLDGLLPAIDQHGEVIEHVASGSIRMRLPLRDGTTSTATFRGRPTEFVSGPLTMGLCETAMFACILGTLGATTTAIVQTMTINFLAPVPLADLIAEAHIIRRGGRSLLLECKLRSPAADTLVVHVTAVYAVRAGATS